MTVTTASTPLRVQRGKPFPLGATPSRTGTNFAVWSCHATSVDVCLYHPTTPGTEYARVRLQRGEMEVWHGFVEGVLPGMLYGYRAYGPHLPANGLRFNARKLLLDPYAKAVHGLPDGVDEMTGRDGPDSGQGLIDNGPTALKSVVIDDAFDWEGDARLETPWSETVIYEVHVKGFTMQHSGVPQALRGTYAGMAEPVMLEYLKSLGVTAVQLLPVHQHLDDGWLVAKGRTNYWGYNTAAFNAPHNTYAAAQDPQAQVREFKTLVKALHRAGLEVILDVVYNHTAEGDETGPVLMLRGLDNVSYYSHHSTAQGLYYLNYTGCGNTVASYEVPALKLILDSMRYWVEVMHVDGFRFDLGVTVGRDRDGFRPDSVFFMAVRQDPVLAHVKLIAEPWDLGPDGYRVGGFPEPWRELNGKFRDTVRRFWRGDGNVVPEFAKRFCGSDDLYGWKSPLSTVNMITSHDGFTLRDLSTYVQKHNLANGEENRDGDNDNHSINHGVEGESNDTRINLLRERHRRNMMATMFLAQGVPFITAGDERARTQNGNNNAYCQDNELSWIDWSTTTPSTRFLAFTQQLAALRRRFPMLRRCTFFDGQADPVTEEHDILWLSEAGGIMSRAEWYQHRRTLLGAMLADRGKRLVILFNNDSHDADFILPEGRWRTIFDTTTDDGFVKGDMIFSGSYFLNAHAVVCLEWHEAAEAVEEKLKK
ncbi:MAG: hypothetical protein JWO94_1175 [Verrucomicrobiaceae bacterium]|nr:hypothetical protein [Verrucomicrobiaceae bacterium]